MSENKQVDKSQTIINYEDAPTLPPPRLEVGAVAWLRQNLFGSTADIIITILSTLFIIALVVSFFDWAIRSANWFAIINNQRLFMMETFEPAYEWRLALTVLIAALLTGVSFAVWARRSMRTLAWIGIGTVAVIAFLPPLIQATIPQPPSYMAAGNVEIVDRASTLLPQPELAFIAEAGEIVEVSVADEQTEDIDTLSNLSGFADRTVNAMSNAAQNRIEQREANLETFDRMLSRELTETLEERTRIGIQTTTRTTDMVASTIEFVARARDNFAEGEWGADALNLWLTRLNRAVNTLEEGDEAIELAIDEADAALDNIDTSTSDAVEGLADVAVDTPLSDEALEAVDTLTSTILESPNIEALGEALVDGVVVDLIGEEAQPDAQEELLDPTELQAAFLREMYVALLTPQSVIETYDINQTDMSIEILDGDSLDILAEGIVTPDGETSVSVEIPADGWYVLRKVPVEGENGTAILSVNGVFPIVERTLSATESIFVRLTDNDLEVTATRPQIDGEEIPFVVLIDNQYRGLRDLSSYLIHFVPLFLEQVDRLFLPFLLVVTWGFVVGRVIAHLFGENTRFSNAMSRLTLLIMGLLPFLIVLAYFAFIDGAFGIAPVAGIVAAVLKVVLAVGAVVLAGQIDSWLNRINTGEDSEASLTSWLIYAWGIFPIVMFVLISGIGGFSGATLGSAVGGLVWLVVMYFVGINFKGLIGYGLLVAGLFMQFAQAFVVESAWTAGTWHDGDTTHILFWLVVAVVGVGIAYIGNQLRQNRDIMIVRGGLVVGLVLWLGAIILTPVTINELRTDAATEEQAQEFLDAGVFSAELTEEVRLQTPADTFDNMSLILADEATPDDVRDFYTAQAEIETQAKTLNRIVAIAGWLLIMFVIGQTNFTSGMLFVGLALMTFHWYLWIVQIDIWSTIYFIIWLAVGMVLFNRGVEAGRDGRKAIENGGGSFTQRFALPGLLISAVVWLVVLYLIPQAVVSLEASGVLQTSPNDLLPLSDKRTWGGLMLTMQLTILGVGASFPIGLALALGRRSNLPVVKTACVIYIEAVRGVPLITVLFLATLLVPLIDPTLATIEGAVRVWVGVTMFSAAYLAENVRGGLQSIPKGQTEAAQAIGLSQWQTTVNILLPQALRAVIPALVGQFISLFKDTSLVVIVGLAEITGIANRVVAQPEFLQKRQETYLYIAIIYFVFSYIMSYISRRVEETGSGAARARQI